MTDLELLSLIHGGENLHVEFKKSTNKITKDVYDTVCSFSNRDGGMIFLGIEDNGNILGIDPEAVESIKKDFITSVNNSQKISPPLYLQPETFQFNDRIIIIIPVPSSTQVCRHRGRIFDRNHEADIDITDNSNMVYQLYARKNGNYFVNKVTSFQLEDLRPDLLERVRLMADSRSMTHPWKTLTDKELLQSAGLFLKDTEKQIEGITIAAILLFGKDNTIMSVLPQHKTDAILRVENLDRYDDRDVITTNLLETYDHLIEFGSL
ncbi:MAG: putative DNA binding domain-containing protein [Eubacterium sp.]|nr:putative DNA binding domain-containing protein [Eubacterium sp.]